jgi:hypothetical protein
MFYISGDLTIRSNLGLQETGDRVAGALGIPPFVEDLSGRYEEEVVYISRCFGLEFIFGQPDGSDPDEYGLSIDSYVPGLIYDGSEKEVDAAAYVLMLLKLAPDLKASAG